MRCGSSRNENCPRKSFPRKESVGSDEFYTDLRLVEDELKRYRTVPWAKGGKTGEYRRFKGLKKQNLRDNMTNMELILNMLAEESTRGISASTLPRGMAEHHRVAASGGGVAKNARAEIERKTERQVISPLNASDAEALDVEGGEPLPPPPER